MLNLTQQVRATERKLQDLTQCEKSFEIPGNFRALQRRVKHDSSKLVFPDTKGKRNENYETHYSLNFKPRPICKPLERPCSPTRRNNPHPSKVNRKVRIFYKFLIPQTSYIYNRNRFSFYFHFILHFRVSQQRQL